MVHTDRKQPILRYYSFESVVWGKLNRLNIPNENSLGSPRCCNETNRGMTKILTHAHMIITRGM
jgi:hypothetical protein